MRRFLHSGWVRAVIVVLAAAGVVAVLWWRGPAWSGVAHAFTAVEWHWVAAAAMAWPSAIQTARLHAATGVVHLRITFVRGDRTEPPIALILRAPS